MQYAYKLTENIADQLRHKRSDFILNIYDILASGKNCLGSLKNPVVTYDKVYGLG